MKVADLIIRLLEAPDPNSRVLIVDQNGLAWALEEQDIVFETEFDGEKVVLIDSPNVNSS